MPDRATVQTIRKRAVDCDYTSNFRCQVPPLYKYFGNVPMYINGKHLKCHHQQILIVNEIVTLYKEQSYNMVKTLIILFYLESTKAKIQQTFDLLLHPADYRRCIQRRDDDNVQPALILPPILPHHKELSDINIYDAQFTPMDNIDPLWHENSRKRGGFRLYQP